MRVVCDNCAATYNIPEQKLTKEVNKATCRKCGHRMLIQKPVGGKVLAPSEEKTQITDIPVTHRPPDDEERPTVAVDHVPAPEPKPAAAPGPVRARQSAPAMPAAAAPPAPAPVPAPTPVAAPVAAPIAAPAAPPPVAAAAPAFDPRGDLSWVLMGCAAAALGSMVLAVNVDGDALIRIFGVGLALFGALLGFLVLLTGGRGTRAANTAVAVLVAVGLSGIGAGASHVVAQAFAPRTPEVVRAPAPVPAPAPVKEDPAAVDLLAEEEPEPVVEPEPEPPKAAPAPKEEPVPVRGSGRDVAAATTPAPPPPAESRPAPPPPPPPAARTGPPIDPAIIETIVTSNQGIKRCYMDEKQRSGTLPRQLKMLFTVLPTGAVSKARVTTTEYKGTDLDICLGGAFRSLLFPPFDGPEPYETGYVIRI